MMNCNFAKMDMIAYFGDIDVDGDYDDNNEW